MQPEKEAIVVMSGGMDSATALFFTLNNIVHEPSEVLAVSFNYGQRHKKELNYARALCEDMSVDHRLVDITSINELVQGSALTQQDVEVPDGHYTEENMRITVVPNRNAIMSNIAIGAAVATGASSLVLGVHAGDHAIYPDCRSIFIDKLQDLAHVANEGFINPDFMVATPFIFLEKKDIVSVGEGYKLPWKKTWTCYKGGQIHCGRCATCVERLEAFYLAGVEDPQDFEDREYWRTVCSV